MRTPRPQSSEPYVDPAEDAASQAGLALAPAVEAIARELRHRTSNNARPRATRPRLRRSPSGDAVSSAPSGAGTR